MPYVDAESTGWRFWLVRPGQDLLLSPYDFGPAWPTVALAATCSTNPGHCPPVADCDCGVHAERSFADARERVRRHRRAVRTNLVWMRARGVPMPTLPSYVVGRVALTDPVAFVPKAGMVRIAQDELRASAAEIVELYVLPGSCDPQLVERLAQRYGVPVSVGEPAQSSAHDRVEKPLSGLHISFVCRFNRARSVMAAAMFSHQLRLRGLGDVVRVSSAGTSVLDGSCIDPQAARVLAEHGYPPPPMHRATQLGDDHLGADLVVALGQEHVAVLQRRGVADDRIRYVEVRNPCWGRDFENAFAAIAAAMPGLHRWVNQRVALEQFETTIGWRFWTWRLGDVLRSPFAPGVSWSSTSSEAPECPRHAPPVSGCCGWYADLDPSDSLARARAYAANTRSGALSQGYGSWDYLVAGKVHLVDVVPFRPPPIARHGKAETEWQARYGTLVELRLLDTDGHPEMGAHARELSALYDIPVHPAAEVEHAR